MLELFHAVLTSLLFSAGMGFGVDQAAACEDEPVDSEKGVDVGSMPSYLASPRGQSLPRAELGEDDQSPALTIQTFFCEPTVWADAPNPAGQFPHLEVAFSTSGRSP